MKSLAQLCISHVKVRDFQGLPEHLQDELVVYWQQLHYKETESLYPRIKKNEWRYCDRIVKLARIRNSLMDYQLLLARDFFRGAFGKRRTSPYIFKCVM